MKKKFYITAAIPYVNADPHIGHALEFIQTDTIKRYYTLMHYDSKSLSGGDENALKNVQAAEKRGISTKKFVDQNTELFRKLAVALDAEFDFWQKGSDQKHHFPAVQKLWNLCKKDIYKKTYKGLYCVGCEAFYTKGELNENGECLEHPGKKLEEVEEENYFFKLKNYKEKLTKLINSDRLKIIPEKRKHEVLSFLNKGLEDISISRSNKRAKNWGVPVPGDQSQKIYVWFDALNIYQSGIGFGWDDSTYTKYWPADVHVIGKGILRFHAIYWPAFLLSAGLKLPKKIFVHEYFTVNGQKMSKSIGNVVDPFELINRFGKDPLRYYFLAKFSPFSDGDYSDDKFIEAYNSDLANGLGNLLSRVAKMAEGYSFGKFFGYKKSETSEVLVEFGKKYEFDKVLALIWNKIASCNQYINEKKVWELKGKEREKHLFYLINTIKQIAFDLIPFLPETAGKIDEQFKGPVIKPNKPLFPRLKQT